MARSPASQRCIRLPSRVVRRSRCPSTGGSFSLDGKSLVFNAASAAAATWCSPATAGRCTSDPATSFSLQRSPIRRRQTATRRAHPRRPAAGVAAAAVVVAARAEVPNRRISRRRRRRRSGDVHRQPRDRSQSAQIPGLQRGLAHHEESLLRREDAWRRLGRGEEDVRAAARVSRRRGGAAPPS